MAHEPVRTCLGCGERHAQRALVRLRAVDGAVQIDRARSGGRGAWLHGRSACLEQATRRKALARAFRDPGVRVDVRVLRELLTGSPRKD